MVLLVTFAISSSAQYLHDVQRTIETFGQEYDNETLTRTPDGGAFMVVNNKYDTITVIRIDTNQNVVWHNSSFLIKDEVRVADVELTSDDGLIICGTTLSETSGLRGFIIKTDATGSIMWYTEYEDTSALPTAIIEAPFGYMTVGKKYDPNGVEQHGVIMGVDWAGRNIGSYEVQSTKFDGAGYLGATILNDIVQTEDGTYACIGNTNGFSNSVVDVESDAIVIIVNQHGWILGNWVYGQNYVFGSATSTEYGEAIEYLPKDNVLLCLGKVRRENAQICGMGAYDDVWLWKIDVVSGAVIWSKQINVRNLPIGCFADNFVYPKDLVYNHGEIAVCGWIDVFNGNKPSFILRTDDTGAATNLRIYYDNHPYATNTLYNIYASDHNSYVTAGESDVSGIGNQIYTIESYNVIPDSCEMNNPEYDVNNFDAPQISSNLVVQYVNDYQMSWDPTLLAFTEVDHCPRVLAPAPPPQHTTNNGFNEAGIFMTKNDGSEITLETRDSENEYTIEVYSVSGQKVTSMMTGGSSSLVVSGQATLNTMQLPAGVYVVRGSSEQNEASFKFIKE